MRVLFVEDDPTIAKSNEVEPEDTICYIVKFGKDESEMSRVTDYNIIILGLTPPELLLPDYIA